MLRNRYRTSSCTVSLLDGLGETISSSEFIHRQSKPSRSKLSLIQLIFFYWMKRINFIYLSRLLFVSIFLDIFFFFTKLYVYFERAYEVYNWELNIFIFNRDVCLNLYIFSICFFLTNLLHLVVYLIFFFYLQHFLKIFFFFIIKIIIIS